MKKPAPTPIHEQPRLTKQILSEGLRSRISFEKKWYDALADFLTGILGTVWFLVVNAAAFAAWIVLNTPEFGFKPFDPYPFGLLTMAVSLEAIFLSIIVLISQNRQSRVADIRQKVNFEVDVRAEEEVTEILKLLVELRTHLGMQKRKDSDLVRMEKKTDLDAIQKNVENES